MLLISKWHTELLQLPSCFIFHMQFQIGELLELHSEHRAGFVVRAFQIQKFKKTKIVWALM